MDLVLFLAARDSPAEANETTAPIIAGTITGIFNGEPVASLCDVVPCTIGNGDCLYGIILF